MKTNNTDAGIIAVRKIYKVLKIDKEWSVISGRGFTWWGHRYAQRVWADEPFEGSGIPIIKINAETDFLINPKNSAKAKDHLASYLMATSLYGLTVDDETDMINFRCSAFIHEENLEWLGPLFSLATIMQVVEAETWGDIFASKYGLWSCHSQHPDSGHRQERDDMLNILEHFVIPEGKKPVNRIGKDDFKRVSEMLNDQGLLSTYSEHDLTAYVPFGGELSLLRVENNADHPHLGRGLLMRLLLPPEEIRLEYEINGSLILDMNTNEQVSWPTGHFLGSWCLGPTGENIITPVFVSFIPAVVCNLAVFVNMVFSMLGHNRWAEGYFFAFDRDSRRPSREYRNLEEHQEHLN